MSADAAPTPKAHGPGRTISRWLWSFSLPVLAVAALPHWADRHWLLDLTSHLAMPCALALTASAVLFLLIGRKLSASCMLAFAAVCGLRLAPLYLPEPPSAAPAGATSLRVVVANACVQNPTPERLREWIEREQPDLFAVLEYSPLHQRALEPLRARYPHAVETVQSDPFGVALFSRLPLLEARRAALGSAFAQAVFAIVESGGIRIGIAVTHPPPPVSRTYSDARDLGLEQLVAELAQLPRSRILVGDLNTTRWSAAFERLLADTGLRDGCEGFGYQGSWHVALPALLRIPIDHVLVSDDLVVTRRELGPDVGSDHLPVVAEITARQGKAGSQQVPRTR